MGKIISLMLQLFVIFDLIKASYVSNDKELSEEQVLGVSIRIFVSGYRPAEETYESFN